MGGELFTEPSSKMNENENLFIPASMRELHQAQRILYCMICKREDHRTSDHEMYIASLKRSENYKAQPYQYASSSKQILRAKAKPFPPYTHYGFNDHRPDDCRNYPECEICRSYDHSTSGHNRVIQEIDEDVLAEPSQSNESSIGRHIREPSGMVVDAQGKGMTRCQELSLHKYVRNQVLRPVSPMSINHEKYTLVIVDEYSRYTWVHFLRKKSQAPKKIMSFIRMVENQNNVKVKQIRTDNGTEFRNYELESFCDEKGISQNFSSPYTPKQNGVAERKNRTLIEAARIMLNGSVLSKHF
ncbi:retrovirus-related pol polyprotein from transposon TNT 1-94 [Tanacetum coccineum]